MFDAHNHLHFDAFEHDLEAVLQRAADAGVRGMVLADYDSARRDDALRIAATYDGVWCTAGLHPWAVTADGAAEELAKLRALDLQKFCAIGELGLDWVRATTEDARALQRDVFREQLALARDVDLPVVIHSVRANDAVAELLRRDGVPSRGGMVHSFWGSREQARAFVDLNLDLSIGPQVTFAQPNRIVEALREVGVARLLVETDAPSRPPLGAPHQGRSEPANLSCVVESMALILRTAPRAVAEETARNARRLFDLPHPELRDDD